MKGQRHLSLPLSFRRLGVPSILKCGFEPPQKTVLLSAPSVKATIKKDKKAASRKQLLQIHLLCHYRYVFFFTPFINDWFLNTDVSARHY